MERTETKTRERRDAGTETASGGGDASRARDRGLRRRAARLFSPRAFLLALALAAGGVFLGGFVPLVGGLGSLAGVFVAGFALGLLSSRRRYLEAAAAGALAAAVGTVLQYFVFSLVGAGSRLLLVGGVAGLFAALVGHYFGRDLRDGLTRDV